MEHLTKQQIVLLCLLVSFVSSIATGIVTVSLMDQAPPAVTQTINRVVERTIERVSPSATTTTETIIVKDDQATVDAIQKASKAIVRLSAADGSRALGVILDAKGRIVAYAPGPFSGQVTAKLDGGNSVRAVLVERNERTGIAVFQAEQSADFRAARAYSPALLASPSTLKLGQSVVAIGGFDVPVVDQGIISSVDGERVRASVRDPDFDSQRILVNLLGEVVGMRDGIPDNAFISSNQLKTYATP